MSSATFSIPKSNMPLLLRFDLISCRRNSTVGKSHFAAEGARLDSPKPENKSTVFTVSIKEKVPPQTYYLKFQDLNSLNWDSNVKGSINLSDLAVVEHLPV
jgi:hypothetical protein